MTSDRSARRPAFLVTIDTEGDNLWAKPREIRTTNARWLPRFQLLCERFGLRPTWLANWEMVNCPIFCEFARDVLARNVGEIGMHLHAWNSPPLVPLTRDDHFHQPFLIEFPEEQIRRKVRVMTDAIEEALQVKPLTHRAGRWAFNATYARVLIECGYRVDCSVTPHVSWAEYKGDPDGNGGADYSEFRENAYFLDLDDIRSAGDSPLLEVPLTVTAPYYSKFEVAMRSIMQRGGKLGMRAARRFFPTHSRFVPNGRNANLMRRITKAACHDGRDHMNFTVHSSELMPGGSPNFRTQASIERLYDNLEELFAGSRPYVVGMTLGEYYSRFSNDLARQSETRNSAQRQRDTAAVTQVVL
jgi:hypothetical protein